MGGEWRHFATTTVLACADGLFLVRAGSKGKPRRGARALSFGTRRISAGTRSLFHSGMTTSQCPNRPRADLGLSSSLNRAVVTRFLQYLGPPAHDNSTLPRGGGGHSDTRTTCRIIMKYKQFAYLKAT